jgi:Protein of unknown function (DUF3551)
MRVVTLTIVAIATLAAAAPAHAQTYSPDYPVCMHVWGPANYYECQYTSLQQCNATASGRFAQCMVNPYFANAYQPTRPRHSRYRHVY